jgi:hypothetical protein
LKTWEWPGDEARIRADRIYGILGF